jgi:hypothetical protein
MNKESKVQPSKVVLAIFVHARGFGMAILENAMTIINAYNVVAHRYPIRNRYLLERIREKIDFYLPEVIILEDPRGYGSRKSKRVGKMIGHIEKYAQFIGVPVHKYSRNDIRFVFSAFNAHTKYEIAKVITENIKHLPIALPHKRQSHEPEHYSMNIFDAISLGVTHYYQS